MKTLLALLLVLGFSSSAFAGNEGPQAMPDERGHVVIADYTINVVFGNPSLPYFYNYQILANGETQLVTKLRGTGEQKVKALKTYSAKDAEEIRDLVKEIVPGKLFDANPQSAGCMDAPLITLSVYQGKERILIGQRANCKSMNRENRSHADEKLIGILEELSRSDR